MSCVITVTAGLFWRVRAQDKLYDCFYIDSLRTISKAENRNRDCWGNLLSGSLPSLLKVVHTSLWSLYCHHVMQGKGELSVIWGCILLVGSFHCEQRSLLGACSSFHWLYLLYILPSSSIIGSFSFSFWDKMLEFLRDGYLQGFPPFQGYVFVICHLLYQQ